MWYESTRRSRGLTSTRIVTFSGVWLLNLGQHVLYHKPGCSSPQLTPCAGLVTLQTAIPALAHTTLFKRIKDRVHLRLGRRRLVHRHYRRGAIAYATTGGPCPVSPAAVVAGRGTS